MITDLFFTKFDPLLFFPLVYPSTHLTFYLQGVPGKQKGWMSRHGYVLNAAQNGFLVCPESGFRYQEVPPGNLKCLDLDEEAPLPENLNRGALGYKEFKMK